MWLRRQRQSCCDPPVERDINRLIAADPGAMHCMARKQHCKAYTATYADSGIGAVARVRKTCAPTAARMTTEAWARDRLAGSGSTAAQLRSTVAICLV